jgi:hypothetical protein
VDPKILVDNAQSGCKKTQNGFVSPLKITDNYTMFALLREVLLYFEGGCDYEEEDRTIGFGLYSCVGA